jgi:DNA polymerase-1
MQTQTRPYVVIDGLSVFIRHYCANPTMSSNGEQMGGFAGFLGSLKELSRRFTPQQIVVVWEGGGSKKRRLIDKSYKNGRRPTKLNRYYEDDIPDTDDNRNNQIALLVKALGLMPVKQVYVPDCEGDDAVAHLVRIIRRDTNGHVIIVSSDRDFYQLITQKISVWSPGKRRMIGVQECIEEYGVHPNNFALAKAIVGDPSDNVKGVSGVGFKTLCKSFKGFVDEVDLDLPTLIDACNSVHKNARSKIYKSICTDEELIRKNLRLVSLESGNIPATIEKKIEFVYSSKDTTGNPNKFELYRLLHKLGLNKLDIDTIYTILTNKST